MRRGVRAAPSRLGLAIAVATCLVTTSALSRQAEITVPIDLKPGEEPTTINPLRDGMVPVAILSTQDFDATAVDPGTVRFSNSDAAAVRSMHDDVNADDRTDLVLLFRNRETGIACGDEEATLGARTRDGVVVTGSEAIRVVGCGE